MTRETATERNARLAQEAYERDQAAQAAYPERLMEVLERACKAGFELTVRDSRFCVVELNEGFRVNLTLEYTPEAYVDLGQLVSEVEYIEEREAEARRRVMVRNAALAKLSQEERELLGL